MTAQEGSLRRRRLRSRPGQSLVEFALIMPLLLLLIFGLVEFARAWNIRHVVTDAAREGARYLAVDNGIAPTVVRDQIIPGAMGASGVSASTATITLYCDGGCDQPAIPIASDGNHPAVRVEIAYPYELRLVRLLLGWAIPDAQLTIRSSFMMRVES